MQKVIWRGGEVAEGAEIEPGTYTTTLKNIYLDEQKLPNVRESTEYLAALDISNYSVKLGEYVGVDTTIVIYALNEEKTRSLFVVIQNQDVAGTLTFDVPMVHDRVNFFEFKASHFTNIKNVTEGSDIVIFVSGYDKLYYINNMQLREFHITIDSPTQQPMDTNIFYPIGCTLIQNRLLVSCKGPRLSSVNKESEPTRILLSVTGQVDNFRIQSTGTVQAIAIDYVILTQPGERFLAVTKIGDNMAILTTTLGVRKITSAKDENIYISVENIATDDYILGESIPCPAFEFSQYLIVATKRTLKAKNIQQIYSRTKTENIDVELPLLASMDSDIISITSNPQTQTIDCFMENGDVKSMHFISDVPAGGSPLSLPITTSHSHENITWVALTPQKSVFEIYLEGEDTKNRWLIFASKSKEFGLLSEGVISPVNWEIIVSVSREDDVLSLVASISTDVQSIWLNVSGNKWVFCKRVDLNEFSYNSIAAGKIPVGTYKSIICTTLSLKRYLPPPYTHYPSPVSLSSKEAGKLFYSTSDGPFGLDYSELDVLHDLTLSVALIGCTGVVGWRNLKGLMEPLGSQKGKLIFKDPEIENLLEFSTNSSADVKTKFFDDYGEVDFSLSKNQRFGENKILFEPISHSQLKNKQKFVHLLID